MPFGSFVGPDHLGGDHHQRLWLKRSATASCSASWTLRLLHGVDFGRRVGEQPSRVVEPSSLFGLRSMATAATETVKASRFFTREQDGLSQPWHGRVWLNPPFSRADSFVTKLLAEFNAGNVEAAILLTNACTDTDWFHKVLSVCRAIFFTDGRISFVHANRGRCGGGRVGQTFFYFGNDIDAFAASFEPIGFVIPFHDRLPLAVMNQRICDIFEASLPYVLESTPAGERAALERRVRHGLQQMLPASAMS